MVTQPTRRRFTVDEYYRMAEAGILGEDDRVELIDGEVICMTPIGPRHAGYVDRLTRRFLQSLGDRAQVRVQNPVRLGEHDEPEPDVTLLRPRPDDYTTRHPTPEDVLLVVEVADSTLDFDRRTKARRYAEHGIPELWIVDANPKRRRIFVYRDPAPDGYRTVQVVRRGERLAPLAFPDGALSVGEILR